MVLPSGLQIAPYHSRFFVCSFVSLRTSFVFQSSSAMSTFEDSFGRYDKASMLPSGDQRAPLSEMSGVFVRLTTSAPSLETANRSYNSPPPKSCSNTIHFPSGDHTAPV